MQKSFLKSAAGWDLEQSYETKSRKGKKKEKESTRLPIKSSDGRIQQQKGHKDDQESIDSDEEWLERADEDGSAVLSEPVVPEQPKIPKREQLLKAQEELAKLASALQEDPEEHPGAFKALAEVGQSPHLEIRLYSIGAQLNVYKDVIPGYRIRPQTGAPGEKLSKEVRRVHTYEQALLNGYQSFLKELAFLAKGDPNLPEKPKQQLAALALKCACTLLTTHPHFNSRGDVLRILVGKLSTKKVDKSFIACEKAIETLFRDDEEGRPSMEAASILSKMMKARDYQVDESVLNLFLHLRLLSEFAGKASQDQVDRPNGPTPLGKKQKQKKEFRTKRERKALKEQKALDKDMANADALVTHEEREKMQAETLKIVFATYFRILKLRVPNLMGAVLEGLAKFAHLINQDFFGDLLEALKDLIRYSDEDLEADHEEEGGEKDEDEEDAVLGVRNPTREALLCTVTAFALLAGQDAHNAKADLHLDLSFFTTHLFRSLFSLSVDPDIELGAQSLRLPDPDSPVRPNKVNLQTMTVLLVRCLTAILLPHWQIRSVPPLRLAAFSKQLMSASLHVPEKSCQAVLALLADVAHAHGRKIAALWNTEERKGDGTFNPLSETVEGSNPFATTVWEGEILRRHYCPKVREGVKLLEKELSG